jgi:hypothetical protein
MARANPSARYWQPRLCGALSLLDGPRDQKPLRGGCPTPLRLRLHDCTQK